jgi:hypothetical protein
MFNMLTSLTKAVVGVAVTPVAVAADVVTMGGLLVDKKTSFTGDTLKATAENLKDTIAPK